MEFAEISISLGDLESISLMATVQKTICFETLDAWGLHLRKVRELLGVERELDDLKS